MTQEQTNSNAQQPWQEVKLEIWFSNQENVKKFDNFVQELQKIREQNVWPFEYFKTHFNEKEENQWVLEVQNRFYLEVWIIEELEKLLELFSVKTKIDPSELLDDKILLTIKFTLDQEKEVWKLLEEYKKVKESISK